MACAFWVCRWVFRTLPCIFLMRLYFRMWCISMIFFSWEHLSCFLHFVLMCKSSTFLSHIDNTFFFFFFHVVFGKFWRENYAGMWGYYGSKIVGVLLGPLSKALGSTTDIHWWYNPYFYGRLCIIYFSRGLDFGGSIFAL
jgi:hypothetical protein